MKPLSTHLIPYRLPMAQPVRTSQGRFTHRAGWWVAMTSGDGCWGFGEAAPWPGFGSAEPVRVGEALEALVPRLKGVSLEEVLASVVHELRPTPEAAHAVECAALALLARQQGQPVAALLGGAQRSRVPVHALVEDAQGAAEAVEAGFGALKVKVGAESAQQTASRLARIREQVGPQVRLRADANGAWSLEQATEALRALEPLSLDWVEQPLAPGADVEDLRRLREQCKVSLGVDESVRDQASLRALLASGAVDVVVLKPMFLGGLGAVQALAAQARQAGVRVMITHALETGLGRLAALHLACALPAPLEACGLAGRAPGPWQLPSPVEGSLALPPGAGLGEPVAQVTAARLEEVAA